MCSLDKYDRPYSDFFLHTPPAAGHTGLGQANGPSIASPFKPVPGELTLWRKAKGERPVRKRPPAAERAGREGASIMWVELKKQLSCNNIKFLVSMQDRQTILEDNGEYFNLTSDELASELVPYGQTDELIREAINLKAEFKNDKVKLVEPRSGTKDRAVVLSYGNYIASLIENEWNKQAQTEEFDINSIQLIW